MAMPLYPTSGDILLRLALTILAGAMIGFDREARGHAAGLRTTILVALAACVAMIQTNLLLPIAGKGSDSFVTMDLMRLPLGILTGVGFIGGGAILKKGAAISGVTTAATLWIVTVIGLCFGGGQLELGGAATALGILTLWGMKWIDVRIARERHATLVVRSDPRLPAPPVEALLQPLGYRVRLRQFNRAVNMRNDEEIETHFDLMWRQSERAAASLDFLAPVEKVCRIQSVELISGDKR